MEKLDEKRAALDAALSRIDCECSDTQKRLLLQHLDLLIEKNKTLNLTRIDSYESAIVLHIEDSLSVYREFSKSDGMFCDIGTGGGFPGIPLSIVSGRRGVLLDSVKKKAYAVQQFIDDLNLGEQIKALPLRSEELAIREPFAYTTVVARAVSSLSVLEELASPLLCKGGMLLAMKGLVSQDEREAAGNAASVLGFEYVEEKSFSICNGTYRRSLHIFEKVADADVKLPRRPGMAQKKPYGLTKFNK